MTTAAKIINALEKAGLHEYKSVSISGNENSRRGIMVLHDYDGPYPTRESYEKHYAVEKIATRNGCRSESRGHNTATLIYIPA